MPSNPAIRIMMNWLPEDEQDRRRLYRFLAGGAGLALLVFLCVYLPFRSTPLAGEPEMAEVNQLAKKKDLEGLKRSASSPNPRVSARAVQAYAQTSGSQGAPAIQMFMRDPRPEVRAEAVAGWAHVGTRNNVQPITRIIATDRSPLVRSAGLQAIARLSAWDGLGAVIDRMVEDEDLSVRRTAVATFEQVAYVRVQDQFDPAQPKETRRAAAERYRRFVAAPTARKLYQDWAKRQESETAGS